MDEGKRPLVLGEVSTSAQKWNRRPLAEPKAISSAKSTHFVTLATNKLSESRKQGDRTSARSVRNSIPGTSQCSAVAEGVFQSKNCPSLVKSMAEEITVETQYFQDQSTESKSDEEILKLDEVADDGWKIVENRKRRATRVSVNDEDR